MWKSVPQSPTAAMSTSTQPSGAVAGAGRVSTRNAPGDTQTPHRQDEIYVVVRGEGEFQNGASRHRFGPGDLLFVPAGVDHRFLDFSEDLAVWVVFYGPDGGEADER